MNNQNSETHSNSTLPEKSPPQTDGNEFSQALKIIQDKVQSGKAYPFEMIDLLIPYIELTQDLPKANELYESTQPYALAQEVLHELKTSSEDPRKILKRELQFKDLELQSATVIHPNLEKTEQLIEKLEVVLFNVLWLGVKISSYEVFKSESSATPHNEDLFFQSTEILLKHLTFNESVNVIERVIHTYKERIKNSDSLLQPLRKKTNQLRASLLRSVLRQKPSLLSTEPTKKFMEDLVQESEELYGNNDFWLTLRSSVESYELLSTTADYSVEHLEQLLSEVQSHLSEKETQQNPIVVDADSNGLKERQKFRTLQILTGFLKGVLITVEGKKLSEHEIKELLQNISSMFFKTFVPALKETRRDFNEDWDDLPFDIKMSIAHEVVEDLMNNLEDHGMNDELDSILSFDNEQPLKDDLNTLEELFEEKKEVEKSRQQKRKINQFIEKVTQSKDYDSLVQKKMSEVESMEFAEKRNSKALVNSKKELKIYFEILNDYQESLAIKAIQRLFTGSEKGRGVSSFEMADAYLAGKVRSLLKRELTQSDEQYLIFVLSEVKESRDPKASVNQSWLKSEKDKSEKVKKHPEQLVVFDDNIRKDLIEQLIKNRNFSILDSLHFDENTYFYRNIWPQLLLKIGREKELQRQEKPKTKRDFN